METKEAKKLLKIIERTAAHFTRTNPYLLKNYTVEDLAQETFLHFLEKGFFEKFDPSITSLEYFVARAAKNYLIDIYRHGVDKASSLDEKVKGSDGDSCRLEDMISGSMTDQYSELLLKEMISNCSDEQVSPNYNLSWRQLLQYLIAGYRTEDLHEMIGISSGRISQLKKELSVKLNFQELYA